MVPRRLIALVAAILMSGMTQSGHVAAQHGSATKALPSLKILTPTNGAVVSSPVTIVFETPADLTKMTMGAHMIEMAAPHLHIDLDKRITMPTLKQLTKVGPHRYRFNLGKANPGKHRIRLYWADAEAHKPMGLVRGVTVTVR